MADEKTSETGKTNSYETFMLGIIDTLRQEWNISQTAWADSIVSPALFGKPIDLSKRDTLRDVEINTYIASACERLRATGCVDNQLLYDFQDEFEGWDKTLWSRADRQWKREMKTLLRAGGVWTGPFKLHVTNQLTELLTVEECPEWPEEELAQNDGIVKRSKFYLPSQRLRTKQDRIDGTITSIKPNPQPDSSQKSTTTATPHPQPLTPQPSGWQPAGTPYVPQPMAPPLAMTVPLTDFDDWKHLPPRWYAKERLEPDRMNSFGKNVDASLKWGGEPYDLFDDKIRIFLNLCKYSEIQPTQFHAVLPKILKGRAETYYIHWASDDNFHDAYHKLKNHFETETNYVQYFKDWTSITFKSVRDDPDNAGKSLREVLQILLDKIQLCQRALGGNYQGDAVLRMTTIRACDDAPELEQAMVEPAAPGERLFQSLRSALDQYIKKNPARQFVQSEEGDEAFYTDRRYKSNRQRFDQPTRHSGGNGNGRDNTRYGRQHGNRNDNRKKCFVCAKEGCWSTKHTFEERKRARTRYSKTFDDGRPPTDANYMSFLMEYEGCEDDGLGNGDEEDSSEEEAVAHSFLMDKAFLHRVSPSDTGTIVDDEIVPAGQFVVDGRYSRKQFQGIMPDTGAAEFSTAGHEQYLALIREHPSFTMDTSRAGEAVVRFGKGPEATSMGTVEVTTPVGKIIFHVLKSPTPFLFCVRDMDKLNVYLRNTTSELVKQLGSEKEVTFPIMWKWGHPWFFVSKREAGAFFTEKELRRLHRRFGHPSVDRLSRLLRNAGHEVDIPGLEAINKFCHQCQLHEQAPRRFKFTLKDDYDFNYEIVVDVMYLLGNKPVLHAVDTATSFQAARFLSSISAKDTWEALKQMWIDTYLGPPDWIVHDAGTNFSSAEFRNEAKIMGIECKEVPVEAHWSIGKVERYHAVLQRAFKILYAELSTVSSKEAILQAAVKAVNDTVGPDGIVPTLLVFGAFPRLSIDSPPSPSTLRRAEAIQKTMKALRKLMAQRQTSDAINTRNGPNGGEVLDLPLQSEVRVWRENKGWQGPFKMIAIDGHDVTLDLPNGPVKFRSTLVRPYHRGDDDPLVPDMEDDSESNEELTITPDTPATTIEPQPRRRGRPRGSKNKQVFYIHPSYAIITRTFIQSFLSQKEKDNLELSLKLRKDGVITAPGEPFEESDDKEITDLIGQGVFHFEKYDPAKCKGARIFKARMVREIKGKADKPYEKSRLVIQGYNDHEKRELLTQSPTIQRVSQRLIVALAPSLAKKGMTVELRDVTQAYPQSKSQLTRTVLARLPTELQAKYPPETIMRLMKPLYGIAEAGVHWWKTYHNHHREELNMRTSTYDPCLLVTSDYTTGTQLSDLDDKSAFGIVGMQTDDTLILGTRTFSLLEEEKIQKEHIKCKPKTTLTPSQPFDFNGTKLTMGADGTITMTQKGQGTRIEQVNDESDDAAQRYIEQRARGAYLASICQPEAAYDLSVAAQAKTPDENDIKLLNKRLKWQSVNLDRGLKYIAIDISTAKLFVFVDGSFANNRDLSSQIGYTVVLGNETRNLDGTQYTLHGNIIHWSSTKCKRITRSVLASEIYGMVGGFDVGVVLSTTLRLITTQLGVPEVPLVICTDSYSLYECLVKLGTTKEKRLMIDIMSLRQAYERREIHEVRWIDGRDNPADAMTKALPNRALESLVSTNELTVRVEGYVDRDDL